jgi:hypothetical protein
MEQNFNVVRLPDGNVEITFKDGKVHRIVTLPIALAIMLHADLGRILDMK